MKGIIIISLFFVLCFGTIYVYGQDGSNQPIIEVVFALDTTGSMSGLIQGAKNNIWSIINTLTAAEPVPEVRVGLVAYRDIGDAYVTQVTELSSDIDRIYGILMDFQASGGGDGPESVNQGLYEAVTRMEWSVASGAYQVIFLVGDYPPHMDYSNDVPYMKSCKLAREQGIVINTILCGGHHETLMFWKDIASRANGDFFQVQQDGSNVMVSTPYDEEMAALSEALENTRFFYGSADELQEVSRSLEEAEVMKDKAAPAAMAQRAEFNSSAAGKKNLFAHSELLNDFADDLKGVIKLEKALLPEELRHLDDEELILMLEKALKEREEITRTIQELSQKRQIYIQAQLSEKAKKESFEYNLFETVKNQTTESDLHFLNNEARF